MKLEELLEKGEYEKEEKELHLALQIAKREWEKVGSSLELCGDIGVFSKEDFMIGVIEEDVIVRSPQFNPTKSVSVYDPTYYPMYLIQNLLKMDQKLPDYGYKTVEALYAYVELATQACRRLGLVGKYSMSFGNGYANARTGWLAEKGMPEERDIFVNMFFEEDTKRYDWNFEDQSVKERLKAIFDRFMSWQMDPELYKREVKSKAVVKPMMV